MKRVTPTVEGSTRQRRNAQSRREAELSTKITHPCAHPTGSAFWGVKVMFSNTHWLQIEVPPTVMNGMTPPPYNCIRKRGHRELFGSVTVTVTPFRPDRLDAIVWDAIWEMTVEGERVHVRAAKILVEYGSERVIQISAAGTEDDSVVVDQILGSFRMTDASEGFWPEMNRLLADIGGFSDAPAGIRRR